jgi:hypothetical protein
MGWMVSVTLRPRVSPRERTPGTIVQEAGWAPEPVWTQRIEEKSFCLCRGSNLVRSVVQPVARHYTDWATRLLPSTVTYSKYILILFVFAVRLLIMCSVCDILSVFRRICSRNQLLRQLSWIQRASTDGCKLTEQRTVPMWLFWSDTLIDFRNPNISLSLYAFVACNKHRFLWN